MSSEIRSKSACSQIEFEDFHLLTISMDSAWTRQSKEPFPKVNHVQVNTNCLDYGEGINAKHKQWVQANRKWSKANPKQADKPCYVDRRLYNPMNFYTLDHGDDAFLILIDDHAALNHLDTRLTHRIEGISLANCIKMSALLKISRLPADSPHFVELRTLFDLELGPNEPGMRKPGSGVKTRIHKIQHDCPFLVFSKFRMDGLCILNHFLLAQQAIFKRMARSVIESIDQLRDLCREKNSKAEDDEFKEKVLNEGDLKHTRCCFAVLEGVEEVGVFIFTRNLTTAFSIASNLRKMTYGDIFDSDGCYRQAMERDECIQEILDKAGVRKKDDAKDKLAPIRGAHVFRWTTTSVKIAPHVLDKNVMNNCRGVVSASLCCRVPPGNEIAAQAIMADIVNMNGQTLAVKSQLCPVVLDRMGRPPGFYVVGKYDIIAAMSPSGGSSTPACTLVKTVLKCWRDAHGKVVKHLKKTLLGNGVGRICGELELQLQVLISPAVPDNRGFRNTLPLMKVLGRLHKKLCHPGQAGSWTLRVPQVSKRVSLDMIWLRSRERKAGLPLYLCQSIERLFHSFHNALANPLQFDLVLDLIDVFQSLHRAICVALPKMLQGHQSVCPVHTRLLDERAVRHLVELVSAIEKALQHRIGKAFPVEYAGDMAIDFRGGLNQVISAANAAMACSVGIYRRFVLTEISKQKPKPKEQTSPELLHSVLGVVSEISLNPGLRCHAHFPDPLWGYEDPARYWPQLAYYDMDFPHVIQPACYADYMHETGHLFFWNRYRNSLINSVDVIVALEKERRDNPHSGTFLRLDEIFAMIFAHILIFGTERDDTMCFYITTFGRSIASIGAADENNNTDYNTIIRYTEAVFRMYMLKILLPEKKISVHEWFSDRPRIPEPQVACLEFVNLFQSLSRYIPEYDMLWGAKAKNGLAEQADRYRRKTFYAAYLNILPYLDWLWDTLSSICNNSDCCTTNDAQLQAHINAAFDRCAPLLNEDVLAGEHTFASGEEYFKNQRLISAMLREYILSFKNSMAGKQRVVAFRGKGGNVEFPVLRASERWHDFLVDKGVVPLFCAVPDKRIERSRKQIVIRKTLRGIASKLQGLRLKRLISTVLD